MTEHFFQFNQQKIAYAVHGAGPMVMLVHGYTESKEIWYPIAKQLGGQYTFVMPDLPGHGSSDLVPELSMESIARMLGELAMELDSGRFTMIGHSMGGYASLCFAEKYGHLLNGIGLFHSNARADSAEIKSNRLRMIDIIDQDHGSFLNGFIPDLIFEENRQALNDEIAVLQERASSISKEALIASQKAMMERQGSIELLATTDMPVLFIIGKQDKRVDFHQVLAQAVLPKRSFVLILENCGHMGYLEAPKDTLAALSGFLLACREQ